MQHSGTLYIIPTPIGNLGDMTLRAIETLKEVDTILCEDTRHSRPLLQHFGINKPLLSYHEHNEKEALDKITGFLQQGKNLALISDAGTPLISDPGYVLIKALRERNISIVALPGACALITALSASGLPTDRFRFEGFLPAKSKARQEKLEILREESATTIFYESTHRIIECLKDIEAMMPERVLVLAKELTKSFETFISGKASAILAWLNQDEARQKGEFVLLIEGCQKEASSGQSDLELERLLKTLLNEVPLKQAVKIACELTGESRNKAYSLALSYQSK